MANSKEETTELTIKVTGIPAHVVEGMWKQMQSETLKEGGFVVAPTPLLVLEHDNFLAMQHAYKDMVNMVATAVAMYCTQEYVKINSK